ncbi:LTA synthase family protein [Planococcus shenhongbingii]|uniref:LTA synthase family protein n=1 Tax=Planococcus shenhongbingii TaxID=3058398 RepID=UPI00262A1D4E|nr:LTA synthase family protein [Planococcus sp. N016]WKA58112.1 LTA synthase family protein [Planococcus sp. N016]
MNSAKAVPYLLLFLFLFIKVSAFRMLIFDTKSIGHIAFVEFPVWALLLAIGLLIFKKHRWLTVWIYSFLVSGIFFAVTLYSRYYTTIPSYYDLQQTTQSSTVGTTILLLINPLDFLFFSDLILLAIIGRRWRRLPRTNALKYAVIGFLVISAITTAYAIKQPIIDISYFAKENGYAQSQLVQMYQQTTEKAHASSTELSPKKLEELKGNEFIPVHSHENFGLAEGRHLFVVQVESMQNFVVGKSLAGQEITPNINALLDESAYFSNVFQQIGAGTTSDAEWIANTGLYTEGMVPIVNQLNGDKVPSLANALKDKGYGSATYHADDIEFWNRDVLYPALGFDEVFSIEDMPDIKQVGFGPADEVLFDFALDELPRQLKTYDRIYSNIVMMTSHTPFLMPEKMQYLNLPKEYEDTHVGNYLQAVRYADEQVGVFIQELKDQGLFDESLIVIFGDHSGIHGSPLSLEDEVLLNDFLGHPYSLKERYTVPLVMTGGGLFEGTEMKRLGGQVDIMPTVLALLGIEYDHPLMGHNLFQYEKNLLGMRYYMPGGSFIQSEQLYKAPGAKLPDMLYDLKTMEKRGKNSETKKHIRDVQVILEYGDSLLKPYIQD